MKIIKKTAYILLISACLLLSAMLCYTSDRYVPSDRAYEVVRVENISRDHGYITIGNVNADTGLIFYPGALVEAEAYAEMMEILGREGYLCVIARMPFDLAVLDQNKADRIISAYPKIRHWYLAGHSLGGSIAASYAADHPDKIDGLILLASYATDDLSHLDLKTLSIRGDRDGIIRMNRYEQELKMLPKGYEEYVIKGGNHCQFGDYGLQEGDEEATVSRIMQLYDACGRMIAFMKK